MVAPPRSAMRPAAAMSHAERPPAWMNASNRPLATYASASAAEPMLRDTRIALRVARTRPATPRPDSASEATRSSSRSLSDTTTARPSSVAGPPAAAAKVSSRIGSWMTPTAGRPSTSSATETQKNGIPFA